MSGVELFPLVLVAALVFTVPGALLGWVSGLRLPWAAAGSVPVSFGVFGLGAWVLGQLDIRYTWATFIVFWLLTVLLAALWRGGFLLAGRRRARAAEVTPPGEDSGPDEPDNPPPGNRQGGLLDPAWLLPAAGALTGMWLIIDRGLKSFRDVPNELETIVQGWDVHWHASMVRWFMDEGIADPTRQGELRNIETGAEIYYPSAWHVGAGLVGEAANLSPVAALNLTGIVLPGMLLPLSVAMIAWKMVGRGGLTAQLAAGLGGIAGTLALAVGAVGLLSKLVADSLEETDADVQTALRTAGASEAQIFFSATLRQAAPAFVAHTMYLLDTNIRSATLLGVVGAGGIGFLLLNASRINQFEVVTTILLLMVAVVLLVEGLSMWLRRTVR